MKGLIKLLFTAFLMSSCHQQLDYGINWNDNDETEQITNNGYKVIVERIEASSYQKAEISDSAGCFLAYITRQEGDDVCTVIKYLHNDSGDVRGILVYPRCYPMPKRGGNALKKDSNINELAEYKEQLWKDYERDSTPNDIGLALVFEKREDRTYATRYYFKYEDNVLVEVYDPISEQFIKADEGEKIDYQVMSHELLLTNDSVIGDVMLHFMVRPVDISDNYKVRMYCGYRPMDELEFKGGIMVRRKIYRSDRPEVYTMVERIDEGRKHVYKLTCDYDDKTLVSTYEDGMLKKVEEVSKWGTVLQQDIFFRSADKEAYICYLKNYDYQKGLLVKVQENRIDKDEFWGMSNEESEMSLQPQMEAMWERFTYLVYGIDD